MKFKCNYSSDIRFFELGIKKRVKKIEVVISENTYQLNTEVEIPKGSYLANVNVLYKDGMMDVIKNQQVDIDGSNKRLKLDMKTPMRRVTNFFLNYKFYVSVLISATIIYFFEDVAILSVILPAYIAGSGSDYYYKKDGFDETFRAVFK